jgi:LacI family transcriptional regulator
MPRRTPTPNAPAPRATLADVAAAAGVDTSTVSRVLRGGDGHRVADDTRERVLACAQALGYRPNLMARGLRTARSSTLGIAVPQLENPVFPEIILGAEAAARAAGYALLISHVLEGAGDAATYEHLSRVSHVDGLLVATLEGEAALARSLERSGVPYVLINRKLARAAHHVVFDNFAAAEMATEHVLALGHRRVAHLAGHTTGYNGKRRLAGWRSALEAAGAEADAAWVAEAGYTFEGGHQAMQRLLALDPRPTAVVAATVLSAAGALKALHEARVRVPAQMSVIAIHDVPMAEMLHPPLTTVRLPLRQMGQLAAQGLIDLIEGRCERVEHTLSPEHVVSRGSTARRR